MGKEADCPDRRGERTIALRCKRPVSWETSQGGDGRTRRTKGQQTQLIKREVGHSEKVIILAGATKQKGEENAKKGEESGGKKTTKGE